MDFKQHLEASWRAFAANLPILLLMTLVLFVVSICSLGIMAPVVTAGYMQSLLQTLRENRKPELSDLFSRMDLFFPLLGLSVLIFLVVSIGFLAFVLPAIIIIGLITFFGIYLLPLMTDQDLGIIDAIKESCRLSLEEPISEHVVVVAVYIGLISLGSSVFLGALFTQPFATLFVLSVYEKKIEKALPEPSKGEPKKTDDKK